jgi:ring-1,2-phenylacetyl-CoA epoxidase subunit PaaC
MGSKAMTINIDNALEAYAVRLGDDALVLGHRLSEWCSNAPFLEEDLALANVALDYIGRARMFYTYAGEVRGDGTGEDDYAYLRDCRDYSNLLIFELPRGDFAFSMARQFLIDVFQMGFLRALQNSADETLAAIAGKAVKESTYHLRRSTDWMKRLGDGTAKSNTRLQSALVELWGYTPELFQMDELETALAVEGVAVDRATLHADWELQVRETLEVSTLTLPEASWQVDGGRRGLHTEHLGYLLGELQFVQRAYPGLEW